MRILAVVLPFILNLFFMDANLKIDFETDKESTWRITNDGVMGGLSQGTAQFKKNSIVFSGKVSLENNGGFSSFKGPFERMDLSDYTKVKIRLKTNDYRIAFTLETDRRWYYPYFKHDILTTSNDWEVIEIPLTVFKEYRIGDQTGRKLRATQLDEILRIGFITNEKRAGDFYAEVDYIEFE